MGVCMMFPDTLQEFLEQYQFKDTEEIYTNGSMLIPVFRVKQWVEHYAANVKQTNVDRIREMTIEELAKVIKHICDIENHIPTEWCASRSCGYQCSLDWLREEQSNDKRREI